jgi:recombination protein RecR
MSLKPAHDSVAKLVFELSKLPGIGEKTATRLAYFILKQDESYTTSLAEAILRAKKATRLCSRCSTFTDEDLCKICQSPERRSGSICVVERPSDVQAVEQTVSFRGAYHVLHGALSPLDGVGPEDLKIRELLSRLGDNESPVSEIILATNPTVEGEATALYLSRLIKPLGIRITKLAHGIPVGGALEYTDRQTISKAIENRMEVFTEPRGGALER